LASGKALPVLASKFRSLLLLVLLSPGLLQAGTLAGRPLAEVLVELAGDHLQLIFNDELVPPQLLVSEEPPAGSRRQRIEALLKRHGLALQEIRPGLYSVVVASVPDQTSLAAATPAAVAVEAPALPDLLVTTSRYQLLYDRPGSHDFLSAADVSKYPRAADETLQVLHRLPGSASAGVSAPPHIRGGERGEILYRLDGLQLYEPFHGKNFLNIVSIFDSRFVQAIDFYSGGFTAEYGDRMSAVVDIRSMEPPDTLSAELGLNLFHSSLLGAGRYAGGRGHWLASFRRSNLDEVSDLTRSNYGEPHYFDMLLRTGFKLNEATRIAFNYLHSEDNISVNNSSKSEVADADYSNDYFWLSLWHDWSDALSSELLLSYTTIENARDGLIEEPGHRGELFDRRSFSYPALKLDFSYAASRWLARWGVEARQLEADYRYVSSLALDADVPWPGQPPRSRRIDLAPNPEGHQLATYLTVRYAISPRWTVEAGLRWDDQEYDGLEHADQWSPRFNVQYQFPAGTRLRLAAGRFYQTHGINELQVGDGVDRFFPAQRADHLVLGLDHDFGDIRLRIEGWYKRFDALRPRYENFLDPLTLIPELQPDRIEVRATEAKARGVELSLARRGAGGWSWWFNYSWSRVTDRIDGDWVARSWDQRHTLNVGLNWTTQKWDVSLTGRYHSGWPTTSARLVNGRLVFGKRNDERFEDFKSVDIKIARFFALGEIELEAFLDVTNVFLFENPCCVEYRVSTRSGGPQLEREQDYWPRIVPNLGLYWRF